MSVASSAKRTLAAFVASSLLVVAVVSAGAARKDELPAVERDHPSGAFSFRTPPSWTVAPSPADAAVLELAGDGLRVRLLFKPQEMGFDGLHSLCMLERLASPMAIDPRIQYEYDFVSWHAGDRRFLDSVFFVTYDPPIEGHKVWRQRTLTVVGNGQSLCINTYAPAAVWKKSKKAREALDAVVKSIAFK